MPHHPSCPKRHKPLSAECVCPGDGSPAGSTVVLDIETILGVDVRAELARIGDLVEQALRSLDDEHEADFARDILELHTHAAACLHLVAAW